MTTSAQAIWIVLLAGSVLLCFDLVRSRMMRVDARVTAVTGGLVGLACLSVATIYTSIGQ